MLTRLRRFWCARHCNARRMRRDHEDTQFGFTCNQCGMFWPWRIPR